MNIHELEIINFKDCQHCRLVFNPKINIIYNCASSTITDAIHKALSIIFYSNKIKDDNNKIVAAEFISGGTDTLHTETISANDSNTLAIKTTEIIINKSYLDDATQLPPYKIIQDSGKKGMKTSEFKNAWRIFYDWHKNTNKLPLLAYFSSNHIHTIVYKREHNKFENLRTFGYLNWNERKDSTSNWISRLEDNWYFAYQDVKNNHMNDANILLEENNTIFDCIIKFSKLLSNDFYKIDFVVNRGEIAFFTHNTKEILFFRNLPDIYLKMFSIVIDIAYRSYLLSEKTTVNYSGIVIFDDIFGNIDDIGDYDDKDKLLDEFTHNLSIVFPNIQILAFTNKKFTSI